MSTLSNFVQSLGTAVDSRQFQRLERMLTEPIYLIAADIQETLEIRARICGKTSTYTVTVDARGRIMCSCPDAKGYARAAQVLCKHALFLILKVGGLRSPDVVRPPHRLSPGQIQTLLNALKPAEPRDQDGDCGVCFGVLQGTASRLTVCSACRNALHEGCWQRWVAACKASHQDITCVYCRA